MPKKNGGNGKSTGQKIVLWGQEFTVNPPKVKDPYERMGIVLSGLKPIIGPCAPNLDAYMAMLDARVNKKLLAVELADKLKSEICGRQVERMQSDDNGDASGEIITETVSAAVHVFARDEEGYLGLQSYALRAAIRECLSTSGVFVHKKGSKERFREDFGVGPLFLRIQRDGKPLKEADGIDSRFVHTWVGKRKVDSICQFEFVDPPWTITAGLELAPSAAFTLDAVVQALGRMRTVGLGAQRSMGMGYCELVGVTEAIQPRTGKAKTKQLPVVSVVQ